MKKKEGRTVHRRARDRDADRQTDKKDKWRTDADRQKEV